MALNSVQRGQVSSDFQRRISKRREEIGITDPQLEEVIDAVDAYFDTSSNARNASIPMPQRSILTDAQKNEIYADIAQKTFEVD